MLTHLSIENLALVERLQLALHPHLNVFTGETGAGKSVLVNALGLMLGGRAQADAVRSGAEEGAVEALFEVVEGGALAERLRARGIQASGGELVVRRTVSRSGRGRVLLNGQMATVGMLQEVLRGVIDVTSQHEHVSLLDADGHLDIVDAFGELVPLRARVAEAHAEVLGCRAALDAVVLDEAEKARREDYLRFALEEISAVSPEQGELEALETERRRLRSVAELADGVTRAEGALYSDEGAVVDAVGRVQRELMRLAELDQRLGGLSGAAAGVLAELEALARDLGRYQAGLQADPGRLVEVEDRLEALKKLVRKHGGSIERVLSAQAEMAAELENLEHEEARRADLAALLEAQLERRRTLSVELTLARQKVVRALELEIKKELAALSMEKTQLRIELTTLDEPGARGAEAAEIMLSPNPGEPLRPLRKTASGGELSRVLLAIKHVLAHRAAVGTYIFDEIDTGIGGATADVLGAKLWEVGRSTQVICVTHHAQVAAYGDEHFKVEKQELDGRTVTRVSPLSAEARTEELARMLGGVKLTARTRELAHEMLERVNAEVRGGAGHDAAAERTPPSRRPARPAAKGRAGRAAER
jgi:DNA repair protein RecN (Recombination protein N)